MKILAFADIHYFAGDIETAIFNRKIKLVEYALPLLDELTRYSNEEYKPDLCVNLGDVIQDTQKHDEDIEALKFMFSKLSLFDCPSYSVLGNHDLKMMDSTREVEALLGYEHSTYSLDTCGYHLVFLTTEVRPELGLARGGCYKTQYLSERDIEWLRSDLEKNTLPAIIFTHFALAEDESKPDECLFMKNREDVKKIIRGDRNILAVVSGHQHDTKTIVEDGVSYYLLGSMTGSHEVPGRPDGVYFEIELQDGALTITKKNIVLADKQ